MSCKDEAQGRKGSATSEKNVNPPDVELAGKTYNSWSEIPSSCFESGVKPPWPPDEDSPPIQIPPYYRPTYAELLDALTGVYF